ncbi:hypothetical protein HYSC106933_11235 [Hydrogenibacillus schlegelii]
MPAVFVLVPFEYDPPSAESHVRATEGLAVSERAACLKKGEFLKTRFRQDEILGLVLFIRKHVDHGADDERLRLVRIVKFGDDVGRKIAVSKRMPVLIAHFAPQIVDHLALGVFVGGGIETDLALIGDEEHLKRIDDRRLAGRVFAGDERPSAEGQRFVVKIMPVDQTEGGEPLQHLRPPDPISSIVFPRDPPRLRRRLRRVRPPDPSIGQSGRFFPEGRESPACRPHTATCGAAHTGCRR